MIFSNSNGPLNYLMVIANHKRGVTFISVITY